MSKIKALFDRMDLWRHFPNYQLERRADLFFSLYLPEALYTKLGFPVRKKLAPEFPLRIGTIYPNVPIDKSYKIDYLAISEDGENAVFVELKTAGKSRRTKQDNYLVASKDAGLSALLEGLLDIFRATKAKRKYFCLLEHLEDMDLLRIPERMKEIMSRPNIQGAEKASGGIEIISRATRCLVVYVQPIGEGPDIISFDEFRKIVARHDDPLSVRFAQSLERWAEIEAGKKRII